MSPLLKRWWWALLIALLVLGLGRIRLDVEVFNLLPDHLPAVHGLRLYQKHFASTRELVITLRAPDAETAESAAQQLAERLRQQTNLVTSAVWQPPWLEHPEEMAELIAYLWLNQPPKAFVQLTNRLAPEKLEALLRDAREQLATSLSPTEIGRLSYDPFGFTRLPANGLGDGAMFGAPQEGFASADGAFRVIFVEARDSLQDYRACAAWLAHMQATVSGCQQSTNWPGDVTVRYTGAPVFTTEVATGMQRDLQGSVLAALVLILVLFWWAHRSWRPLFWLLTMLVLAVTGTLASGGLIFGRLNAVSLGFAAVLLGLAVDYGLVLYQESLAAPHLSARELRRLLGPGIVWSAVTTAAVFGLLNFAGLPGLSQLGSLVGIGIFLAATLMLFVFLPLIMRRQPGATPAPDFVPETAWPTPQRSGLFCRAMTVVIIVAAVGILWRAWPRVDHSNSPLQPRHSAAQVALDELQAELSRQGDPLLLVVAGRDELEVAHRLEASEAHLARAVTNRLLRSYLLPTTLWPHAERQRLNLTMAGVLAARADALKTAATAAGFTDDALALTTTLLRTWTLQAGATNALWPTNRSSRWLLKRAAAWTGRDWLAVGALYSATNSPPAAELAKLNPSLPGVWLTGWTQLGETLLQSVEHRLWGVLGASVAMLGVCLWMAFGRWREVFLSFAALAFSLLALVAMMGLAGWTWNLMNLMAVPLLLGAGVDYTIHVQLALRRHGGDPVTMRRITGRAVFLCAATTVAGFGSNALSGNAGLASLGMVCAAGIAITYLACVFLLPAWWVFLSPKSAVQSPRSGGRRQGEVKNGNEQLCAAGDPPLATRRSPPLTQPATRNRSTLSPPSAPSPFYRIGLWRLGLAIVRVLPDRLVKGFCVTVAELSFLLERQRREVVVRNLLPALSGNRLEAEKTARRLYRNFAVKLVELWRVEDGVPVRNWLTTPGELDVIHSAMRRGRGVLFVTPHLGHWEHGGLLLAELGIQLTVLTLAEPDEELTRLRMASRERWRIQTLIIGQDSFALVEVIKRLQDGATLAISIDRPPERGAVMAELFGRPYAVSLVAAELARASGCALVGVTIVRRGNGYAVRVLPEFTYARTALGEREARRELTQQMLRAFEPEIREHLDQWYQFVPIWPENE